ncbi:disease resistance protein TAO1-like isoform X2 [Cryptomeria japonica]|uniref:disease resistance protein TAO1-like isoform X2 n=1 Tax=Cryptomeria japonica TaxID=3369 RepID=UPI0027DA259F|nr:disease resistance protein TAO1-like isoform X2 [Cryptomeria japonica]
MHDQLRDLGREIANQHSPYWLWQPQHIVNAHKQIEKRNAIQGIMADRMELEIRRHRGESMDNICGVISSLAPSLAELNVLVIRGGYWNHVIGQISRELVWLRWSSIGQRNLRVSLNNLRVLELYGAYSLEELWEADNDAPVQLRELVIYNSFKFQRFPNSIGCLKELRKIVIEGNTKILSLPEEFCRLQSLEHLQLGCPELLSLPSGFGNLRNLRYLNLYDCYRLMLTSENFQHMTKLEF